MNKNKKSSGKSIMKVFMCFIYLIIMTVLFVCSYHIFLQKEKILPWDLSESTGDYTYMDLSRMSEKFAYYEESNIGLHFGIEEEKTGLWHTYVVAINEDQYEKYKALIDYTYERTEKKPDKIRVYGYPVISDKSIKDMVLKNIVHFLPAENEVEITEENYEKYFTNSYLDTTREKEEEFNVLLCGTLFLLFIVIVLFFLTIFDRKKSVVKMEE